MLITPEKCNTLLSNNGEVYLGCSKFQLWYLITPDRKGVVISLVMLQGGKAVAKIQSTKASANYKDARTEFSRYVDTQINELLGTISTAPAKRDESSLRGPNINAPPSYKEDGQTESSSLGQNYRLTAWAP